MLCELKLHFLKWHAHAHMHTHSVKEEAKERSLGFQGGEEPEGDFRVSGVRGDVDGSSGAPGRERDDLGSRRNKSCALLAEGSFGVQGGWRDKLLGPGVERASMKGMLGNSRYQGARGGAGHDQPPPLTSPSLLPPQRPVSYRPQCGR